MPVSHDEKAVREFPEQAAGFADPGRNGASTRDLDRLVRFMDPEVDIEDIVLEVAAGTAPVSRAIARRVRHVTALDAAPAMLAEGKRAVDRDGVTNVTFAHGDATALPYLDRSFTLVVTRFSLHRATDPKAVVREMERVSRPGAAIFVADLVRPDDLDGDPDRIARLRDPAHGTVLTEAQIGGLVTGADAEVKRAERFEVVRPLEPWLDSSGTPEDARERIRGELRDELGGGPATGMRPSERDGELHVVHSLLFLHAVAG
ncbi:class I SAM-dependent methyltransferase [Actinomadura sp. WMMB 499]|uniref:class I SAM-dependent methyltransferase n=1 Tax=Actinomadura sp. WMMB 499 TaxID=1219491 RepID=UPI001247C0FE|nr:methyltransferase domain-containing protein [Actinomadura sp. WMMB 499]QFG25035.1 methyltransferase domain-containing protein [Actinomadura sp. WMMB 499]